METSECTKKAVKAMTFVCPHQSGKILVSAMDAIFICNEH